MSTSGIIIKMDEDVNVEFKPIPSLILPVKETYTKLSIPTNENETLTKRVIAPYVTLTRKGHKLSLRRSADHFSFFLQKKSSTLLRNLSIFLTNKNDLPGLLYESLGILKGLTKSLGARLYLVDKSTNLLYQYQKNVTYPRCRVNYKIEAGTTVAAYVALNQENVMVPDVTVDPRFPEGVSYKDNIKPVLCAPITTKKETIAVMEFYREMTQDPYSKDDLKTVVVLCGWIGLTIQQNKEGVMLHKKQEINDDVLQLVLAYYRKTLTLDRLLGEILLYTKYMLDSERGAFYIIDMSKLPKLIADVYEECLTDANYVLIKKRAKVRFAENKSVPGYVAHNKELLNVRDVYNDTRFSREIIEEHDAIVINRTELCVPILNNEELLGILTIVNKKNGAFFTDEDEALIRVIATYCCMVLHHAKLINESVVSKLKLRETTDILTYHLKPSNKELREMEEADVKIPQNISEFSWYVIPDDLIYMPQLFIYMLKEIVGEDNLNIDETKKFVLTVHSSYRDNPYHNFEHAFNVAHCMYTVLLRNKEPFTFYEQQALLIACLTHDIDHQGSTNNFLTTINHHYYQLYDESPWENHHVYVTMKILSVYNIFNNLDVTTYPLFLDEITKSIFATDLVCYFKTRTKVVPVLTEGTFNMVNPDHKRLATAIMMTVCDLSGQSKPMSISKPITDNLYKEFYNQGDREKALGVVPLAMMDRDNQHHVPEDQVQFISIVVMPAAKILKDIFPNTEKIFTNTVTLRDTWKKIIESRGEKIWRQGDSVY